MTTLVALLVLQAKLSIALPTVSCLRIEQPICEAYADRFANQLAATGEIKVVTSRDISQVLGLERQKQLLGCADENSSCNAELAGALGVDGVLSFSVTLSDGSYVVTLRAVHSKDGTTWASVSNRVGSESALFDELDAAAVKFTRVLTGRPENDSRAAAMRAGPFVTAAAGLVLGITGIAIYFAGAKANENHLRSAQVEPADIASTVSTGRTLEAASWALIGTGAAALVAGVLWWLLEPGSPTVAFFATRQGGAFAVGGAF